MVEYIALVTRPKMYLECYTSFHCIYCNLSSLLCGLFTQILSPWQKTLSHAQMLYFSAERKQDENTLIFMESLSVRGL